MGTQTSSPGGFGGHPHDPLPAPAPVEHSAAPHTRVQFWGVRGSIACPDQRVSRYGGNTSCVEVRCGNHLLILDGGTGLRQLGKHLVECSSAVEVDIFYTHFHFDHICGLPFFAPCYLPTSRLRLWAGNLHPASGIADALHRMMSGPLFPTGLDSFKADVTFNDFRAGDVLAPHPGVRVRTAALNHPGGSTGYRVEHGSGSLAYITDTEHRAGELDPEVLALARDVDLMIYDCNYTDDEWPAHIGWGHSTWQQGVRLATAAKAKRLAIFHHDPDRTDDMLDRVAVEAKHAFSGTFVAAEGLSVRL